MTGFDLRRAFNDAFAVYQRNVLVLVVAAFLFQVLAGFSLGVLGGPLLGGISIMLLRALKRDDRLVELGDMFSAFDKFGPLVGMFYLWFLGLLLATSCCVAPGIALRALWLFPFYLMMDRGLGIVDSLKASWQIALRKGVWPNVILAAVYVAVQVASSATMGAAPALLKLVGWLLPLFALPLIWLAIASAYIQQVQEDMGQLADILPAGGPPSPESVPATP
jgi:hypothetical protein